MLLVLIALIGGICSAPLALMYWINWFVIPIFNANYVSYMQCWGLFVLIGFLRTIYSIKPNFEPSKTIEQIELYVKEKIRRDAFGILFIPWLFIVLGYVVKYLV